MKNLSKVLISAFLLICATTSSGFAKKDKVPHYNITLENHKFSPSVIEVPANTKFRLIIKNKDKTAAEFESHDLKKERIIKGGKKSQITIKGQKPGTYKFFDEFHEKTAQGKVIVK